MGILNLFKTPSDTALTKLEARLDQVESQMKLLKLEWQETYDKVSHALDRVGKRWSRILAENNTSLEINASGNGPTPQELNQEQLYELARKQGVLR